jgi:hypothetical protein
MREPNHHERKVLSTSDAGAFREHVLDYRGRVVEISLSLSLTVSSRNLETIRMYECLHQDKNGHRNTLKLTSLRGYNSIPESIVHFNS